MSEIDLITREVKGFARQQQLIDFVLCLILALSLVLVSGSIALFFLKSPVYGLIGIIPLLFYRPVSTIERARSIEGKTGLKGELVNSLQLSSIHKDGRERYSQELIDAYINDAAAKVKAIDFKKHLSYDRLQHAVQFLLISIVVALIHPAVLPEHFWYSLNHKISYSVEPGDAECLKGDKIDLRLHLNGVYLPKSADLIISAGNQTIREKIAVLKGTAEKEHKIDESITYQFTFLDYKTEKFSLTRLEPIYIERLSFHFKYPAYTQLKNDTKTGRQIIAPEGTRIQIQGSASQALKSGTFSLNDTLDLLCDGKEFSGKFVVKESGTAILHLKSFTELKEQIIIYSIPDLAPLVDIFYPGYNINLPSNMQANIGIRCSDDYGLRRGIFFYDFKQENRKPLSIKQNAMEDTIFFKWDISDLGMFPGDEISYFAEIYDNAGKKSRSKVYYIYFPTMEEIYEEIDRKEELVQEDLKDLQLEHAEKMDDIARAQQKIMKERQLLWADKEKLQEVISREKEILDKIDEWQEEFEKTIEKLNQGVMLDQESVERLKEIMKILKEIAPDELRRALENVELSINRRPQDLQKALENLKKSQQDLARALERTLEILKRFQQEEKLKELAQTAKELAAKAEEIDQSAKENKEFEASKQLAELDKKVDELAEELMDLAESEGLEQEIKQALEKLAQQAHNISEEAALSSKTMKKGLALLSGDLEELYKRFTRSRVAELRRNLLEIINQLIDISKTEENIYQDDSALDIDKQDQIIKATKTVAESLYTQQTKSLYVTPGMGKNLSKAIQYMERSKQGQRHKKNAQEAMRLINLVSLEMLRSLEKSAQGTSSTGVDKFMQGLSEISMGQMSLTQSMSGFLPIPISGLSPEQQAQIQRLAGKQRALRKALESLRNEVGANEHQGQLDNIIDEMKKTEEALFQYKLDRKLIERQKKIISRLLDAQKSIRKEDYEKKRKSKPGKDFLVQESPKRLPEELGEDELRELIRQALKEPYPKEYELYIREYFKRLLEER